MRLLLAISAIAMGANALDLCQMNEIKEEIRAAIPTMLDGGGGRGDDDDDDGGGRGRRRLQQMTSRGDAVGGESCHKPPQNHPATLHGTPYPRQSPRLTKTLSAPRRAMAPLA
jgi:hypothetical protein